MQRPSTMGGWCTTRLRVVGPVRCVAGGRGAQPQGFGGLPRDRAAVAAVGRPALGARLLAPGGRILLAPDGRRVLGCRLRPNLSRSRPILCRSVLAGIDEIRADSGDCRQNSCRKCPVRAMPSLPCLAPIQGPLQSISRGRSRRASVWNGARRSAMPMSALLLLLWNRCMAGVALGGKGVLTEQSAAYLPCARARRWG